jgi:hypothetical protein
MLLAACGPSDKEVPAALPYAPADLQHCFREATGVPDKALTVSEVEALWKEDRVRLIVNKRCGERMQAWYASLRKNWK